MSHRDIIFAGAAAAFSVDLLIYPLDTLKTRLQSPHRAHRHFRGLYQGVGIVVVATLPASAVFFTTYETLRSVLPKDNHVSNSIASSVGELASCAVLTPAEVIKQNAQVISSSPASNPSGSLNASLRAFRAIPHTRDLFRGYVALVARNLPFTAMHYPIFEAAKKRLLEGRERQGVGTTVKYSGLAAGVSGAVAATLTTPIDVVKTRIMLSASERNEAGEVEKKGVRSVVGEVLREEGWRGLWRGGTIRAVWTGLGIGLYLGVYEGAKFWLVRRREQEEGRWIDIASGLREAGEGET